ncbi:TPA: hypothetical protein OC081_000042 [Escherichia coli]|nr:hypothetical protein [Escherichia coli]
MIITRADLREWRIGAVMYRWFLRHFPRGGSYADIHHALIEEGYTDWAESLVEYAWKKWLADENFAHQEVSSMQKLATDPGEIPFCSQFARSDDHARIGCCEDNARIATAGYAAQIASFGANARIANSGDNVHIIASGENSTVVSTGVVDSIILGPGGSAALAYHDGERVRFAVAIEGENNIRTGVRYRLNEQHQFVEC